MGDEQAQVRHLYGGQEIDPIEAATIHMALEELRDRSNAYLEVEVAEDDSASRIEASLRGVASELGLRLLFAVESTRHGRDARGRMTSEPSVLRVSVDRATR